MDVLHQKMQRGIYTSHLYEMQVEPLARVVDILVEYNENPPKNIFQGLEYIQNN